MTPKPIRQHTTEIDIDASPDQVFRAITEAEEIVRWFAPQAKVEPGPDGNMVGGSYSVSWGPGFEGSSKIAAWEPGRRFATLAERTKAYGHEGDPPVEGETVQRVMIDYRIEARGGSTHLRLVHSGFGHGEGWDNEFEGTKRGWPVFLWVLKHGIERHPGEPSLTVSVAVPRPVSAVEAWRRLIPADLKPGDRYSLPNGYHGTIRTFDPPKAFGATAANLNDGLLGIYCDFHGHNGSKAVEVSIVLWGDARARAQQVEAEWKEILNRDCRANAN